MKTQTLIDIAAYVVERRQWAESHDAKGTTEYSPTEGVDLVVKPGCFFMRCTLTSIEHSAVFFSLGAMILSRLGFVSWDIKVEILAPSYNPPKYFPEVWAREDTQYFWVKISTISREHLRNYRGA